MSEHSNELNEILAEHIKGFAKQRDIPVTKLLRDCDLPQSYIQDLKRGRKPNYETVLRIAERLQTSCDYLLGKTPFGGQDYHSLDSRVYSLFDKLSRLSDRQLDEVAECVDKKLREGDGE